MTKRCLYASLLFMLVCGSAYSTSFDCNYAETYAETTICSNHELSRLDDRLSVVYEASMATSSQPDRLRSEQRKWLAEYREACRDIQCLKDTYTERIRYLEHMPRFMAEYENDRQSSTLPQPIQEKVGSIATNRQQCVSLDKAMQGAIDARTSALLLETFAGRSIYKWKPSDYDRFLALIDECSMDLDIAPVLHAFSGQAKTLLETLRSRVTRLDRSKQQMHRLGKYDSVSEGGIAQGASLAFTPILNPDSSSRLENHEQKNHSDGNVHEEAVRESISPSPVSPNPSTPHTPSQQPTSPEQVQTSSPTSSRDAGTQHDSSGIGAVLIGTLVAWLMIVIGGIVAGWKEEIVVFRNFDDLAIVFFMGVLLFGGFLISFFLFGALDNSVPFAIWSASALGIMALLGWTMARTWRDQYPRSIWRFLLAMITKMSLGILFVNGLFSAITPAGKTMSARSRGRASAILRLAILTPIVFKLVRSHEGVWVPNRLFNSYTHRRTEI